jgi:hypothetical protein
MSDRRTRGEPVDGDPPGQTPSVADLHDAITRHLDGGLDVDAQRVLARRLAVSPEARRLLAGHLRLEAALIRLGLAGELGSAAGPAAGEAAVEAAAGPAAVSPAPEPPAPTPGRRRAWRSAATDLAIAAAALVALTLAPWRAAGPGQTAGPAGGEMHRVAAQWLLVAREPGAFDTDAMAVVADDTGDDAVTDPSDESAAGPPAWLVAAMADEEFQRLSPDAG